MPRKIRDSTKHRYHGWENSDFGYLVGVLREGEIKKKKIMLVGYLHWRNTFVGSIRLLGQVYDIVSNQVYFTFGLNLNRILNLIEFDELMNDWFRSCMK